MGVTGKFHQMDSGVFESKKWATSRVSFRNLLKPICTKPLQKQEDDELPTTPTSAESIIPSKLSCPAAPRKGKPSASSRSCHYGRVREFFNPPELETIFMHHVEGA